MPEVTSVEAIRASLNEFQRHLDDALVAVRVFVEIRADARRHLDEIRTASLKGQEAQRAAEGLRSQMDQLAAEWVRLKQEVVQAGDRLAEENRTAMAAQAELLGRLEASTRSSAATAEAARADVLEAAGRTETLLQTARHDLEEDVRTRLSHAEDLIESETRRVEKYLEQEHALLKDSVVQLRERTEQRVLLESSGFKEEVRLGLSEHQRTVDRQLTDFLSKQNALVQNLTQQIDSYHRAAQAQAAEHAQLAASVAEVNTGIGVVRSELAAVSETIRGLGATQEETAMRLERTLEKLRALPMVGSRFR